MTPINGVISPYILITSYNLLLIRPIYPFIQSFIRVISPFRAGFLGAHLCRGSLYSSHPTQSISPAHKLTHSLSSSTKVFSGSGSQKICRSFAVAVCVGNNHRKTKTKTKPILKQQHLSIILFLVPKNTYIQIPFRSLGKNSYKHLD